MENFKLENYKLLSSLLRGLLDITIIGMTFYLCVITSPFLLKNAYSFISTCGNLL